MIKNVTTFSCALLACLALVATSQAQVNEYELNLPTSEDIMAGYASGLQSGTRDVAGPYDLDGDGQIEVLAADYTGGGRVHVIENRGANTWELVYSTPWMDSTGTTNNIRAITAGDLDGDGFGEIVFLSGRSFSEFNPNLGDFPPGLYVFEAQGNDDYGTAPATIYEFGDDLPDRWRAEQMGIMDLDDDGVEEFYMANNGSDNRYDNWYVLSVNGDIGSGFEVWVEEMRLSSRSDEFDLTSRGGGSPYAIHPADLDGDGLAEISMHSWNNFNFTAADVSEAGVISVPDSTAINYFLQASDADQVSFFGGVVVDIDNNGDDEIFYPNLQTGNVAILNYEEGEDPMQITMDNITLDVIPGLSSLGIGAGDLDGDGNMELFGTGPGYAVDDINGGTAAEWINIVEFMGGDPEDPMNYTPVEAVAVPTDNYDAFHTLNLLDGSTERSDQDVVGSDPNDAVVGSSNPEFASKFAYLGDADQDGLTEIVFGIQGIPDSLYTLTEVAINDSTNGFTVASAAANENRIFLRVMSTGGLPVSIDDERIVLPNDYVLHENYPNPFNPTTTIRFTLPLEKAVSVKVYDVTGRLVNTIVNNQVYQAGTFEVTWDGRSNAGNLVSSGMYLYTLEYGNFRQTKTMTLIK